MSGSKVRLCSWRFSPHVFVLITAIGLWAAFSITADLSLMLQIALFLSLAATGAALVGLFHVLLSRQTQVLAEAMLEALPTPVYLKSVDGRYSGVNSAWEAFVGISRESVIGRTVQELKEADRAVIERLDVSDQTVRRRSGFHVYNDVISRPDGARHDAIICKASFTHSDTPLVGLVGSIIDMTDRKRAERRMMMEHAVTRVLAEAASLDEVVPTIIETICKTMGWHYGALYKYHPCEEVLRCEEVWGIDTDAIREFMASVRRRVVKVSDSGKGLVRRTFALGKPVWIPDVANDETLNRKALVVKAGLHGAFAFPLRSSSEVLGILEFFHADVLQPDAMLLEIAESIGTQIGQYIVRRKAETEKHLAMHDAVTGLPNRLLFMERFEHALVQAKRHARQLAVMFIDLDRFKLVNDTLGHEAGDMLLKEVSRRLTIHLREGDTVARLGGDEFVMLIEEITSAHDMQLLGEKLIGELRKPCSIGGQELTVTASIGVSMFPADSAESATLLRHADAAMYRAKAKGRNLCEVYSGCNEATVPIHMHN
jgi:diguanylate cyclase (GGDEF)-like protein/PAS domain S-box-containing protein